jgi:hypothetical protein
MMTRYKHTFTKLETMTNHGGNRLNAGRHTALSIQARRIQSLKTFFAPVVRTNRAAMMDDENETNPPDANDGGGVEEVPEAIAPTAEAIERSKLERERVVRKRALDQLRKFKSQLKDKDLFDELMTETSDENDDDEGVDYNVEDENIEGPKRKKRGYQPAATSAVALYLKRFQRQAVGSESTDDIVGKRDKIVGGQHWFPPEEADPVASGKSAAKHWYLYHSWIYAFLPFLQYGKSCNLKSIVCPYCKVKGQMKSKEYCFRPMFEMSKVTQLFHRRILCDRCKKSTAEIDSRIMSQLPTRVAARFEFVTTVNGPGIHESLLYAFVNLMTKAVFFGTFAKMVNEIYAAKYTRDHVSHIETMVERAKLRGISVFDPNNLEMFSPYHNDTGGYCLPRMTKAVLKSAFESFMRSEENYMQTSFQTTSDEGIMRDDSHKFTRCVKLEGRKGKVLNCSTTVLSNRGLINNVRLRFTKSHAEIRQVFEQLRLVRENDGVFELLRFITDNPAADTNEMERLFPSLRKNVVPYRPTVNNFPRASINLEDIVLLGTHEEANTIGAGLIELLDERHLNAKAGTVFVGIDMEWNAFDNTDSKSQCLIIAFPGQKIYVMHLTKMDVHDSACLPSDMKLFLEDKRIRCCGSNIGVDLARLASLGVNIQYRLDTVALSKLCYPTENKHGLDDVARRVYNVHVDKGLRTTADWSIYPPANESLQYMGLDGYLSLGCAMKMYRSYASSGAAAPPPDSLSQGKEVDIVMYGKVVAKGVVTCHGNAGGMAQTWGKLLIGAGKATVRLTDVMIPAYRPSFDYNDPVDKNLSWKCKKTTFGDLFKGYVRDAVNGPEIAVRTSSLRVEIDLTTEDEEENILNLELSTGGHNVDESQPPDAELTVQAELTEESTTARTPSTETTKDLGDALFDTNETDDDDMEDMLQMTDDEDFDYDAAGAVRTRGKSDLWHDYHACPLEKKCPAKALILSLVINATTEFVTEDLEPILKYVKEELAYDDWRTHFRFNREWWRKRVRLVIAKAEEHAARIRLVREQIASDRHLGKYYTKKVEAWFNKLEANALAGLYEELGDVSNYLKGGIDSNGFQLWFRNNGSVRCENFHKIMRMALAHHSVGVKTAHYLLVMVAFRYNVNTGVARLGHHDFGHPYLHLIDRIQNAYHTLFGIKIYPRHRNLSHFKPIPDHVAVGIGPLSYDADCVRKGPPMNGLKGDVLFLAERMGLECPPLPVGHKDEYSIFSQYFLRHPRVTATTWRELGHEFLQKTDGKTIYPKLQSMLKSHYQQWKQNQLIRRIENATRDKVKQTMDQMQRRRLAPASADPVVRDSNVDGSIPATNFVPPLAAPEASSFVPSDPTGASDDFPFCYYEGYCPNRVNVCGGRKAGQCTFVNCNLIEIPADEAEFESTKTVARNKRKAKEKAERRASKKRQRS